MVAKLAKGTLAALIVMSIASMVFAQEEGKSERTGHFAIKELMPVVDPEMAGISQVDICAAERVHRSQMVPSGEGGITKTRVVVRSEKKDSPWLIVSDQEPPYKMYRIITHGDIATSPWADTDSPDQADTDLPDHVPLEEPGADIVPTLSWAGAEHIFLGTVSFGGVTFDSDLSFPLHFKLVEELGYVYLCGRGTVTTPDGQKHRLGYVHKIKDLIPALAANDQLTREAAAEALGWLAKTKSEIDKAVPALIKALKDDAMEVRRNAAVALGRTGDLRAREALKTALQDEDEWVREVVADALKKLGGLGSGA